MLNARTGGGYVPPPPFTCAVPPSRVPREGVGKKQVLFPASVKAEQRGRAMILCRHAARRSKASCLASSILQSSRSSTLVVRCGSSLPGASARQRRRAGHSSRGLRRSVDALRRSHAI